MDYSKLKYIRLFKDEYSEEKWKDICEVLGVAEKDSLTNIELGVIKSNTTDSLGNKQNGDCHDDIEGRKKP